MSPSPTQYKSEKVFKTYKKLKEEQELILANKTATKAERHNILSAFKKKFNSYHKLTRQLRKSVDKQMRQMFAGGTGYSPEYQVLRDTIEIWSRFLKLRKQINTSRITTKRMVK
jgi:acetoin utilization deacetylase AcuC-like enzyme